ncbi:MAG: condensation domain-containing protein, partial [Myxococcales bacterium]
WLNLLSDYQPRWELPADRSREVQRTYSSKRVDVTWDETASRGVGELSRRLACTMVVTWLALLQALLWRIARATDVVIGIPSAGQVTQGEPRLVGHCVHLLPVRLRCHDQDTFAVLAARAKAALLSCLEHPEVTYSALLADLAGVRKPGQLPLVSMTVNVDHGLPALDFGSLRVSYETIPRQYEIFELAINVVLRECVCLQFNFNTRLFEEATVRQWMGHLQTLMVRALASPRASLSDLCTSV